MAAQYSLASGVYEAQGRRETMEDTHVRFDDASAELDGIEHPFSQVAYYGVYDGHGGTTASQMVQDLLHTSVFKAEQFSKGDIPGAIDYGYGETDKTIVTKSNDEGWMNGSTSVTGIVADRTLYIGNIGDSEAILVSLDPESGKVSPINLTTPHKASDESEKKRIEDLGGHVFFGRVFGALAVSRAFGDSRYKQPKTSNDFVTAEPAHKQVELSPTHKYLVLACDGLWDVMNHQTAADIVHRFYQEGKSPSEVARLLVDEALRKRTEDNVTVVVVYINWNDEGSSSESDE